MIPHLSDIASPGMEMTKKFEGWSSKPYHDSRGNLTIGWGFNISNYDLRDRILKGIVLSGKDGLDKKDAQVIFDEIYLQATLVAMQYVGQETYNGLTEAQRDVLNDMAYNLGNKLYEFKKMKEALIKGDFQEAAKELKNSRWYTQVGERGKNHYLQIQK